MESFFEVPTGHKAILAPRPSASLFIAEEPTVFTPHWDTSPPTAPDMHSRVVQALSWAGAHSPGFTCSWQDAQVDTLEKVGDGSMFAVAPTEQMREEHTHPALPSSGMHTHWVSVCRLFHGTALLCLELQLEVRKKVPSLFSFTLQG